MVLNFSFLRSVLGGAWHVNMQTMLDLLPMRNLILSGVTFEAGEPESSSLPFLVAAEDYSRFTVETATDSGEFVLVSVFSGVMTKRDQYCGPMGTQRIVDNMLKYDKTKNIVGHVMFIDSGGGQTISLDPFKQSFAELKKPCVAYVDNMAASAAYGIASFAKEIYAGKNDAVVGSIGTMISFDGFAANEVDSSGMRHVRLYASKSVKKNAEFEAALSGNYKPIVENLLNPTNEDFINMILSNRKLDDKFLDGSDYRAVNVVGQLVDGIMSFENTVARVVELARANNSSNGSTINSNLNGKIMSSKTTKLLMLAALLGSAIETDADGFVSLSAEHAAAVDAKLSEMASALKERDAANAALASANKTIAERDATIAERDATIEELNASAGATPAAVVVPGSSSDAELLNKFKAGTSASIEEMLAAMKGE